jgi:hypothetical protein
MRLIARKDYVVRRLEREDWPRFHDEVNGADLETAAPLLGAGITKEAPTTSDEGESPYREAATP